MFKFLSRYGGIFPLLLYPSVIPQDGKELAAHPTIEASVILMKDQCESSLLTWLCYSFPSAHGVTYVKYATFLLQQMSIEIDEDFIFALLDLVSHLSSRVTSVDSKLFDEALTEVPEPQPSVEASDVYFETLHLQPMQLDISFMRTDKVNSDASQTFLDNRNVIAWFLNALTMALGNVNDAPIRFNMLLLENARLSLPVLTHRVIMNYNEQFMGQLYRVLGSADFLGNPIGLFQNVSSGIGDIFYAPYEGLVAQNQEFGHSIAKGASSFVRKTVFGVSDSVAKISGSIGKGKAFFYALSCVLTPLQVYLLQLSIATFSKPGACEEPETSPSTLYTVSRVALAPSSTAWHLVLRGWLAIPLKAQKRMEQLGSSRALARASSGEFC
jgi:vacuolar protein sorting-associated protein 13A/C